MGINNFYGWIHAQYVTAVKYRWLTSYDHVYIDLNYALHYVSSSLDKDSGDLVYEKLYEFISDMLHKTLPRKSIVLATDGIPPIAKLSLQRKRRFNKATNEHNSDKFNTVQFTPGTKFMETLDVKMKPYFDKIISFYNVPINLYFGESD